VGCPVSEPRAERTESAVQVRVASVDVYVLRPGREWEFLLLRRSSGTRCPRSWEVVHGRIEPSETPEDAALREVREETGLEVERLYSVTVQPFYLHRESTVYLAVAFAAFVADLAPVVLGTEHDAFDWLGLAEATQRASWPRSRATMPDILALLGGGDAGPLEDVLRVR